MRFFGSAWEFDLSKLPSDDHYWGRDVTWYDGPIYSFGFGGYHWYAIWQRKSQIPRVDRFIERILRFLWPSLDMG